MYLLINHNNIIEFDEGSWLQNLIFEFSGRYVNKEKLPENEAEFVDEVCDMLSEQEKQAYLLFSGYRGKASTYKEIAEELNVTFKEAKQLVAHAKTQLSWKANLIEDKLFRISPAAIKSNDLMFIQQLYDFLTGNLLTSYNDVFEHLLNNGVYISSDLSRMIAEEISDFFGFHTNSLLILKQMVPDFEQKLFKLSQEQNNRLKPILEKIKNRQNSKNTVIRVEISSNKKAKKVFELTESNHKICMDEIYKYCFFKSGERICESEILNDKSKAILLHEGYFYIRDIWQDLSNCEEVMREKGCLTNFNKFKKVYQPEYKEVIQISKTAYNKMNEIGIENFEAYLNRSPELSINDLLVWDSDEIELYLMRH